MAVSHTRHSLSRHETYREWNLIAGLCYDMVWLRNVQEKAMVLMLSERLAECQRNVQLSMSTNQLCAVLRRQ